MVTDVLPKIERTAKSLNYGQFAIGPLESGYGITLGNALRRVLLSSLPGVAITSLRISDVYHEFSPIPFVREDTTELLLNVKQLRMKMYTEEPVRMHVDIRGEGPVTAADLHCPPEVEIVNPDLLLLTADSDEVNLDLELVAEKGRGYSPAEERGKLPLGEMPVDAIFSPIRKVKYTVARARVGQQTDYDRLILEIWTDGTISPEESLGYSAQELVRLFSLIAGVEAAIIEVEEEEVEGIPSHVADAPIEGLDLSVRAFNCLKRAGITRVGEVLERLEQGEDEILAIRNFGRKSLIELVETLQKNNYLEYIGYQPGDPRLDDGLEEEDEDDLDEDDLAEDDLTEDVDDDAGEPDDAAEPEDEAGE